MSYKTYELEDAVNIRRVHHGLMGHARQLQKNWRNTGGVLRPTLLYKPFTTLSVEKKGGGSCHYMNPCKEDRFMEKDFLHCSETKRKRK
jgi:hypothetical protein